MLLKCISPTPLLKVVLAKFAREKKVLFYLVVKNKISSVNGLHLRFAVGPQGATRPGSALHQPGNEAIFRGGDAVMATSLRDILTLILS